MQEYYTTSWPGKKFGKVEILRTTEEETRTICRNLNETEREPDYFIQKVILLTVEEYEEMVTRIKELEEECDNLVN